MSMTQRVVDELRELGQEIASASQRTRKPERRDQFTRWANRVFEAADDLGDD
jgi:hypothetical protein